MGLLCCAEGCLLLCVVLFPPLRCALRCSLLLLAALSLASVLLFRCWPALVARVGFPSWSVPFGVSRYCLCCCTYSHHCVSVTHRWACSEQMLWQGKQRTETKAGNISPTVHDVFHLHEWLGQIFRVGAVFRRPSEWGCSWVFLACFFVEGPIGAFSVIPVTSPPVSCLLFCRLAGGMCRVLRLGLQVVALLGCGGAARCLLSTFVRTEHVVLLRSLSSVTPTYLATSRYRGLCCSLAGCNAKMGIIASTIRVRIRSHQPRWCRCAILVNLDTSRLRACFVFRGICSIYLLQRDAVVGHA